ncbi:hypothetical protein S245_048535, partial [Arachis hypogaea]
KNSRASPPVATSSPRQKISVVALPHLEAEIEKSTVKTFNPFILWQISFFKQFYGFITESDYVALHYGFIKEHCQRKPQFDFHNYMVRKLEVDFRRIVSISWYLWLFVVLFLLLNIAGWHTYFWLAFLPVILEEVEKSDGLSSRCHYTYNYGTSKFQRKALSDLDDMNLAPKWEGIHSSKGAQDR